MNRLQEWVSRRLGEAPIEFGSSIDTSQFSEGSGTTLIRGALSALEQACLHPGRVRASAFQILTADALITYACELALDEKDPDLVLGILMQRSASHP